MNTTINLQNPSKRCFATELSKLDLDTIISRQKDIENFYEYGIYSNWMIYKESRSIFSIKYWDIFDIKRYRKLISMELLDRCIKFELYPELKFYF